MLHEAQRAVAKEAYPKVAIILDLDNDLPQVKGMSSRLERAFVNIMLNAIQQIKSHSEAGGVLVVSSALGQSDLGSQVRVRFIDTGPGIHRTDFERIFERGFSNRKDGTGLGLYITRGLVEVNARYYPC